MNPVGDSRPTPRNRKLSTIRGPAYTGPKGALMGRWNRPRRQFGNGLAVAGTKLFAALWACYGFTVFGLCPILDPHHLDIYLYWSNVVQLVATPMLMAGIARIGAENNHDRMVRELVRRSDFPPRSIISVCRLVRKAGGDAVESGRLMGDSAEETCIWAGSLCTPTYCPAAM